MSTSDASLSEWTCYTQLKIGRHYQIIRLEKRYWEGYPEINPKAPGRGRCPAECARYAGSVIPEIMRFRVRVPGEAYQ